MATEPAAGRTSPQATPYEGGLGGDAGLGAMKGTADGDGGIATVAWNGGDGSRSGSGGADSGGKDAEGGKAAEAGGAGDNSNKLGDGLGDDGKWDAEIVELDALAAEREAAGAMVEGLAFREKALVLRQARYGTGHADLEAACQLLALQYNSLAMQLMDRPEGGLAVCTALLKKAEVLTGSVGLLPAKETRLKLRALTCNNFGCALMHFGKLHTALRYLDRALRIEAAHPELCENPAGTHLNICAILSQMGRHEGALQHADYALEILLQERLLAGEYGGAGAAAGGGKEAEGESKEGASANGGGGAKGGAKGGATADEEEGAAAGVVGGVSSAELDGADAGGMVTAPRGAGAGGARPLTQQGTYAGAGAAGAASPAGGADSGGTGGGGAGAASGAGGAGEGGGEGGGEATKASLLAIAYYNKAVELEHLKRAGDAVEMYEAALTAATKDLGEGHPMAGSIRATIAQARKQARAAAAAAGKGAGGSGRGTKGASSGVGVGVGGGAGGAGGSGGTRPAKGRSGGSKARRK